MSGFIGTLCRLRVQARDRARGMKQLELPCPGCVADGPATLGSAGQTRLDFEESLSTLVCVCWADHSSHCTP